MPEAKPLTVKEIGSRQRGGLKLSEEALLTTLDRPAHPSLVPTTMRTLLLGLIGFGVVTAIANAFRLIRADAWRSDRLDDVTRWLDIRGLSKVRPTSTSARWCGRMAIVSGFLAMASAFAFYFAERGDLWQLWFIDPFRGPEPTAALMAFLGFVSLAHVLVWIGANLHAVSGQRFVNELREQLGWPSDERPVAWRWGLSPVPAVAAALLGYVGVLWAVPMLLAANVLRLAVQRDDRRLLSDIGTILRGEMGNPTLPPVHRIKRCPLTNCRADLTADAAFCPRCGRSVGQAEAFA